MKNCSNRSADNQAVTKHTVNNVRYLNKRCTFIVKE